METLISLLPWAQVGLAVILTAVILVQQRGASVGGIFGGSEGTVHYERRGFEKTLFQATIAIALLFVLSVFVQLFVPDTNVAVYTQPDVTVDDTMSGEAASSSEGTAAVTHEDVSATEEAPINQDPPTLDALAQ